MKGKRKSILCLTVICLMLISGCTKKEKAENMEINLEENPTTGYTLSYEIKDKDIVKVVSDEYKAEDKDTTGAGGIHTYVIKGLKEGETTIEFTSKQDWDGGETDDSQEITVVVDKNLSVTEK